jgi:phosphoribosyl 1,2-cyclic phosphodiesterase
MHLKFASLNSGSNGNCYYIGNDEHAVMIDAGLSRRETERRMQRMNLRLDNVRAIFISHEHIDHVRGVEGISKRYGMPVYMTSASKANSQIHIPLELLRDFKADTEIAAGNLKVTAFTKKHDAADPHSFVIEFNDIVVGVMTDIGASCDRVKHFIPKCHALLLESNYDHDMLMNGRYPYPLKQRVSSDVGHLSNAQAYDLINEFASERLRLLLLGHLSKDNNREQLVRETFMPFSDRMHVEIASRFNESRVYEVSGTADRVEVRTLTGQMSIF